MLKTRPQLLSSVNFNNYHIIFSESMERNIVVSSNTWHWHRLKLKTREKSKILRDLVKPSCLKTTEKYSSLVPRVEKVPYPRILDTNINWEILESWEIFRGKEKKSRKERKKKKRREKNEIFYNFPTNFPMQKKFPKNFPMQKSFPKISPLS